MTRAARFGALVTGVALPLAFAVSPSTVVGQGQPTLPSPGPTDLVRGVQGPSSGYFTVKSLGNAIQVIATGANNAQSLPALFGNQLHNSMFVNGFCNGLTDNTAAIQAEIYAAAGVADAYIDGGIGNCIYSSDILVPSNSRVIMNAYMLQKPNTETNAFHFAGGSSNSVVTGNGTIDGNGANESSAGAENQGVISQSMTTSLWVSGLHFVNTRNSAINLAACKHCFMSNDYVEYTTPSIGHAVQFSAGASDCWADNMHIDDVGLDGGFAFYGGVSACGISNSISTNNTVNGFGADDDAALPNQSHDLYFSSDIAMGNSQYAYTVGAAGGTAEANIVFLGDTSTGNNYGGYHIEAGTGILIADQKTHSDIGPTAYCVNVDSNEQTAAYVDIEGGQCSDEGQGGNIGIGVQVNSPSSAVYIHGLHIYDDEGTPVMAYGITGSLDALSGMEANLITGMRTASVAIAVNSGAAEWQYDGIGHYLTNQAILSTGGFYAGTSVTSANVYGATNTTLQQGNQICFNRSGTPTWCQYQDGSGNLDIGPLTTGSGNVYFYANGLSNTFAAEVTPSGGVVLGGSTLTLNGTGGPTYKVGSGAPTGACVSGSHYVRSDSGAAAGSQEYSCRNVSGTGTWESLGGG
jgi:hypothetical protein